MIKHPFGSTKRSFKGTCIPRLIRRGLVLLISTSLSPAGLFRKLTCLCPVLGAIPVTNAMPVWRISDSYPCDRTHCEPDWQHQSQNQRLLAQTDYPRGLGRCVHQRTPQLPSSSSVQTPTTLRTAPWLLQLEEIEVLEATSPTSVKRARREAHSLFRRYFKLFASLYPLTVLPFCLADINLSPVLYNPNIRVRSGCGPQSTPQALIAHFTPTTTLLTTTYTMAPTTLKKLKFWKRRRMQAINVLRPFAGEDAPDVLAAATTNTTSAGISTSIVRRLHTQALVPSSTQPERNEPHAVPSSPTLPVYALVGDKLRW